MKKHLSPDGFFRRNERFVYSSTFPPTTVAATTAIMSGLYPNQTGRIGWTGYYPQLGRNIVHYTNRDSDTDEKMDFPVADTLLPFDTMFDKLSENGIENHMLASFLEPCPKKYSELCDGIAELCGGENEKFIYAYWDEPDHSMHFDGIDCEKIHDLVISLEEQTRLLAQRLDDTLLIVTADHGHVNSANVNITNYPDITDCLVRPPSVESRALNFFVRDGMEAAFEKAFRRHFGDSFILYTMDEVREKKLFGTGAERPGLNGMLGNYFAVATGGLSIRSNDKKNENKGGHAGFTPDELTIPFIAVCDGGQPVSKPIKLYN